MVTIVVVARKKLDHVRRGFRLQQQGRQVEAEAEYRHAIHAGDDYAYNNLGTLYVEMERLDEAREQFRLGAAKHDAKAVRNLHMFQEEGGGLPGIHPSPNIQEHPDVYEWENLAADPESKLEAAMWRLGPWSRKTVLDVGCGTGSHLPRFAAKAARVIGVEPHRPSLRRARVRVAALPKVEVRHGSAEALPVDDASIDVAHARFAYFFGPRAKAGIIELNRVMRPGGSVFVIDNDPSWGEFAQWLSRSSWIGPPKPADKGFWEEQGFETQTIQSEWRFRTREQLEQVLRIEFPTELASQILAEHSGTAITYGYLLRHRRYQRSLARRPVDHVRGSPSPVASRPKQVARTDPEGRRCDGY